MAAVRMLCSPWLVLAACLACAAPAHGEAVLVLDGDGRVMNRADPGVASRQAVRATHFEGRAAKARRRTVIGELKRLYRERLIDRAAYDERRASYEDHRAVVKRLTGRRRVEMAAVVANLEDIAARGDLGASRLEALWLTLERNREWWNEGPLLANGQRVSFEGSELVWQYFPGEGLQIHPLANFGKLNALWRSRVGSDRMTALLDELLPLAAERAGGVAWEYYFDFNGGRPPWVSSLAQGTGLQSMGRAAVKSGRVDILPLLRRGLGVFKTKPPEGVRRRARRGIHFLQYSYAPRLRILNGFVQSLVGLYDFAELAADEEARVLFTEGETAARVEVPTFDTGAWSLYSRGSIERESDLNYHGVLIDFLVSLCDRTAEPVYCDAVDNFRAYLDEPPELELVTERLRGGRQGALRFRLSKISRVTVRVYRGETLVLHRSAVLGRGLKTQIWVPPRKTGDYAVQLDATDLAGNAGSADGTIEVLRPARVD